MLINKYLVVGYQKGNKSARLSAKPPSLKAHEIAIKINLDIPDSLFSKPILEADIVVPKDAVNQPKIDAEVCDNIAATVNEQLGIAMHVSVIN